MPRSKTSSRGWATISFSCRIPIAAKTGAAWLELAAGLAVCATTQIEQEAASLGLGWLCVDSAATVHNMRDRESHTDHRLSVEIFSCIRN